MAGAFCTFSTFKPKNLVLPCLISRCKEKSYVLPLVASSPNSSAGLWIANATTAPTVKLPKAGSIDSIRTVRANLGSKSTCPARRIFGENYTTLCTVARRWPEVQAKRLNTRVTRKRITANEYTATWY